MMRVVHGWCYSPDMCLVLFMYSAYSSDLLCVVARRAAAGGGGGSLSWVRALGLGRLHKVANAVPELEQPLQNRMGGARAGSNKPLPGLQQGRQLCWLQGRDGGREGVTQDKERGEGRVR